MKRILIMAGGTGGHIFPALAVAQNLAKKGHTIAWLGRPQSMEANIVNQHNIPLYTIQSKGLKGKGLLTKINALFTFCLSLIQSLKILNTFKPDVVLGMGGYVSGAGGISSWLLRIPLVIHEQNAIAGTTNTLLAPLATQICQAFKETFNKKYSPITTGNPLRNQIQPSTKEISNPIKLLIMGGSLGASIFNEQIPKALQAIPESQRPDVWHQTGAKHQQHTLNNYSNVNVTARIDAFIENMGQAYEWADLIICRAGAMSVAELANSAKAAILVPYPYAINDHQTANARHLSEQNAAILVPQQQLTSDYLTELMVKFSQNPQKLTEMGLQAHKLAQPDATNVISDICLNV